MADWSQLPNELLHLIAKRLDTCFDVVHFRSVCSLWRSSVSPRSRRVHIRFPLPWDKNDKDERYRMYCFFQKVPVVLFRLPQTGSQSLSSCWLLRINCDDHGKMMPRPLFRDFKSRPDLLPASPVPFNSLNQQIFELGHEHTVCYADSTASNRVIHKRDPAAIMWLDAKNKDYVVLAAFSHRKLSMFRSRDTEWSVIDRKIYHDVASFNGKFYAVDGTGTTIIVTPSLDVTVFAGCTSSAERRKFAQSNNGLFLVDVFSSERHSDAGIRGRIRGFSVFKLNEAEQMWVRVEDTGDRIFFLGEYATVLCLAGQVPGIKGNSIVFCKPLCERNVLVFDLGSGNVRSIKDCYCDLQVFWSVIRTSPWVGYNRYP